MTGLINYIRPIEEKNFTTTLSEQQYIKFQGTSELSIESKYPYEEEDIIQPEMLDIKKFLKEEVTEKSLIEYSNKTEKSELFQEYNIEIEPYFKKQLKYSDYILKVSDSFNMEKTKNILKIVRFLSKNLSIFLFSCFIISFFTSLIHPLFWLTIFFGAFGLYGAVDIRIREELNG